MMIGLTILGAWLLADFATGIVHWAEDKFLDREFKISFLNQLRADNDLHHSKPAALIRYTYWENINTSAPFTLPSAAILFAVGAPAWLCLAVFFGTFANLVHRFSHTPQGRLPKWIRFMQRTGLFISIPHHAKHHFDAKGLVTKENSTRHYCPMTNWLNPWLDRLRFFHLLEWCLKGRR